jgi:iron complex transport system substrate-binding protein
MGLAVAGCGGRPRRAAPAATPTRGFPVTVTDDLGHRVTVEREPRRIVSLAPNVTETLFALGLGERVVGVSEACDYPPAAVKKPRVGGFARPSVERVLSVKPDLVIASRGNPPDVLRQIERIGVPVYGADPETIDAVIALARILGRLTGDADAGAALARDLSRRVKAIEAASAQLTTDERPRVLIVISDEPLFVAGSKTFIDDLIRAAGGRNAASEYPGFPRLGQEPAAMLRPDVIVTTVPGKQAVEDIARSSLSTSPAVEHARVYQLDADIVTRPGPRLVDALGQLHALLHP